jgi:hypothetical protein
VIITARACLVLLLKVAERTLARQGHPQAPRQLVEMVTATAASIAGLGGRLGTLEQGRPADLLVLERRHQDPYQSVVAADPSWVQLVMVDGDLANGRADWLTDLVDRPTATGWSRCWPGVRRCCWTPATVPSPPALSHHRPWPSSAQR